MMIRVLIANSAFLVCDSMRATLNKHDDIYVVGCASQVEELRFLLPQCDVALVGAQLAGEDTVGLINELRSQHEALKLIVVGVPHDPAQIVRFVEAGAIGYILENEFSDDLVAKIRAAVNDKALVSGRVAAVLIDHINNLANSPTSPYGDKVKQVALLTPRQREVMKLVSNGLTNQEIANELFIQCGTVKNHVHHILKKIDASNRYEASSIFQTYYRTNGNGKNGTHLHAD